MTQHSEYFTRPSSLSTETGHPMTLRPQLRFPKPHKVKQYNTSSLSGTIDMHKEAWLKGSKNCFSLPNADTPVQLMLLLPLFFFVEAMLHSYYFALMCITLALIYLAGYIVIYPL